MCWFQHLEPSQAQRAQCSEPDDYHEEDDYPEEDTEYERAIASYAAGEIEPEESPPMDENENEDEDEQPMVLAQWVTASERDIDRWASLFWKFQPDVEWTPYDK